MVCTNQLWETFKSYYCTVHYPWCGGPPVDFRSSFLYFFTVFFFFPSNSSFLNIPHGTHTSGIPHFSPASSSLTLVNKPKATFIVGYCHVKIEASDPHDQMQRRVKKKTKKKKKTTKYRPITWKRVGNFSPCFFIRFFLCVTSRAYSPRRGILIHSFFGKRNF